jgi:hypothetical protein
VKWNIFEWWHSNKVGAEYLKEVAVAEHRNRARDLINQLFRATPLLGMTRIVHEFNDYHVTNRRPVGSWRVTIERISPPPGDGVVRNFERRTK